MQLVIFPALSQLAIGLIIAGFAYVNQQKSVYATHNFDSETKEIPIGN